MVLTSAYEVKLEVFEGPLDLLLHLIRKQDMDIQDIQISSITQEYLAYLEIMKNFNLDSAGEFLLMASTLMQIKAQMLLPKEEKPEGEEGPDPRAELAARLEEYQKFKEAGKVLASKELQAKDLFYRSVIPKFGVEEYALQSSIFDLMDAFKDLLARVKDDVKELLYTDIPLEQKVREILDVLSEKGSLKFFEIFSDGRSRRELVVTFLAVLELIRLKQIIARQDENLGEIMVYKVESAQEQDLVPLEDFTVSPEARKSAQVQEEAFVPVTSEEK